MKIYIPKQGKWRVRVHDYDTWSLDDTLAKIITPCLKQLKERQHGCPGSLFPPLPEGEYYHTEEQSAEAFKKWGEILDKMIWTMENMSNPPRMDFRRPAGMTRKEYMKRLDDRLFHNASISEEQEKIYDEHTEELKEYRKRIQEGCELFGKHFTDLWD